MLDYQADIDDDLSVFHRVDDPMQLSSSRYFRMVERLPLRDGAVRFALRAKFGDTPEYAGTAPAGPGADGAEPMTMVDDVAELAAMSQQPGFPGIAYTSGG